jgi:hypothetical protein
MPAVVTEPANRAGWSIPMWCQACDISRASYYNLELRPRSR